MTISPQGSDTSQGDGWWLATDGKWYPPRLAPAFTKFIPPLVLQKMDGYDDAQLATFTEMYDRQHRDTGLMVVLAIFFPIQLILLKHLGLWFAFIFTGGGLGIWWILEWFLTPGRVRTYNAAVAMDIAVQIEQMGRSTHSE